MSDQLSDTVLLRLGIQGIPPEQVRRVAEETARGVEQAISGSLNKIADLEKKSARARTDETHKRLQGEIAAERQKLRVMSEISKQQERLAKETGKAQERAAREAARAQSHAAKEAAAALKQQERAQLELERAQERAAKYYIKNQQRMAREARIAANASQRAWRRTLEDLENMTVVMSGLAGRVQSTWSSLKGVVTGAIEMGGIYDSAGGADEAAISAIAKATGGQISNTDIIKTRNYALTAGIEISEEEFQRLAAAADQLGDSLGTDAAEGMMTLVQAIETGNVKALRALGIVIQVDEAERKYAESIGKTVDALSDEEKIYARKAAILGAVDVQLSNVAGTSFKVRDALESTGVALKNTWDRLLAGIGNSDILDRAWNKAQWMIDWGAKFDIGSSRQMQAVRRAQEMLAPVAAQQQAWDAEVAQLDTSSQAEAMARMQGRWGMSAADQAKMTKPKKAAKTGGSGRRARGPERLDGLEWAGLANPWGAMTSRGYLEMMDRAGKEATQAREELMDRDWSSSMTSADRARREAELLAMAERTARIEGAGSATTGMSGARSMLSREIGAYRIEGDEVGLKRAQEALAALEQQQQAVLDRAGGKGILTSLLFGPDGPDVAISQMDTWQTSMLDGLSMISSAGMQVADALAESMASALAGADDAPLAQKLAGVAKAMSKEALLKGLMETAEGVASLAMYNYPAAALHFKAAAAFGAVGVAAGLASRGLGGGSNAASSAPMQSRGGGSSGRPSSSGATSASGVTLNVTVYPGGEARAGKAIVEAMEAYQSQSGRKVLAS